MGKLLELISLKQFKGGRTQIAIVAFAVVNTLNQLGVLNLTPEQLNQANQAITWAAMYFFAEKVSK